MPVSPYKGEIYTLRFGAAGMVAHPNRWLSQPSELVVAQNITFENDYIQKEAAAAEYDTVGIAVEAPFGTFSALTDSTMAAAWLPATATAAFSAQLASLVANTTSPWVVPLTGSAAAGQLLVVALGQTTNVSDLPLAVVTDTQGNVYTRLKTTFGTVSITSSVELWASILTTGVTAADSVILTFTHATTDARAVTVASFTGVLSATSEVVAASSFDNLNVFSSATNTYAGQSYPALLVAAVHWRAFSTTTATWAGGFVQRGTASSGAILSQLSLAAKLAPFSTAILAQYDWKADVKSTPAGNTLSVTINSNVVTGAGPIAFVGTFWPGDEIIANGETEIVDHISGNTQLETVGPWQQTLVGVPYDRRSGPRIISAALSGKIYKEAPDQGGNTGNIDRDTLVSGLTTTRRRGRFIAGGKENAGQNRKLFYFNGVDPVQVLNGDATTMTAIATPPVDWGTVADAGKQPINGIVHQGCLFGFGNLLDPYRIYKSDPSNHELFTGANAGQYPIASNVGERLFGAAEFQGVLFLWKYPVGIFYFDDTDPSFLNWTYHQRSEALGCAPSPHAVLPIDQDVLFCAADGHFHLLSAVSDLGGTRTSDLTRQLGLHGWMRDHVATTALSQMVSAWDPATKVATFGVQSTAAVGLDNDLLLRFDFGLVDRGGPVRFSYSTVWKPGALTIKRRNYTDRPALLIGTGATCYFVDPFHYGYRTIQGVTTGFAHTLTTPQLDFSDQDPANRLRRKHYDAVELILANPSVLVTNPLTVAVYVDNVLRQTQTFRNASRRPMLQLNCGDGYEFALSLSSASGSTVDIPQLGALIYWRPGGQDKSRAA